VQVIGKILKAIDHKIKEKR